MTKVKGITISYPKLISRSSFLEKKKYFQNVALISKSALIPHRPIHDGRKKFQSFVKLAQTFCLLFLFFYWYLAHPSHSTNLFGFLKSLILYYTKNKYLIQVCRRFQNFGKLFSNFFLDLNFALSFSKYGKESSGNEVDVNSQSHYDICHTQIFRVWCERRDKVGNHIPKQKQTNARSWITFQDKSFINHIIIITHLI